MQDQNAYDQSDQQNSVYDRIKHELSTYYEIKYNEVSLEYEIVNLRTGKEIPFNESSLLIHLDRKGITSSLRIFKTFLRSHMVPKYNDLEDYFKSLVWDGKDYIDQYASYVKTDDDLLYRKHLKTPSYGL